MKDLAEFDLKCWTITLMYNRAEIIEEAMAQYYRTRTLHGAGFQHVFVQHHYPFNKRANAAATKAICEKYGGLYLDPGKNLGLHDGFNWAMNQLPIRPQDFIIMYDGDNFPIQAGWDDALTRVLFYDPKMVWSTLWQPAIRDHQAQHVKWSQKRVVDHINVWIPENPFVKTVAAWKAGFLKSVGGFSEPTNFWGHLESSMFQKVRSRGMLDCYLPDFYESSGPSHRVDPEYQQWKVNHAHNYTVKVDLEQWLRETGRAHLIGP